MTSEERAIQSLVYHWGTVYRFEFYDSGIWMAQRKPNGYKMYANGPEALRTLVRADYLKYKDS